MTGATTNTGMRDVFQNHKFKYGEFGLGGLYHEIQPGLIGSTEGVKPKFHLNFERQDQNSIWTYDGTFPPKVKLLRLGEPTLFRHYNGLPVAFDSNRYTQDFFSQM
jgi:hypothetical protein